MNGLLNIYKNIDEYRSARETIYMKEDNNDRCFAAIIGKANYFTNFWEGKPIGEPHI